MRRYRSKTVATWLAVLGGTLGAHRFYLHGWRDPIGWLYLPPTLLGLTGAVRMHNLGQDDGPASLLVPLLGLSISAAMLTAIVYGLCADERWQARFNPGQAARASGWGAVLGVVVALLLGATVLMGTIAFAGQRFFEWQRDAASAAAPAMAGPGFQNSARPT